MTDDTSTFLRYGPVRIGADGIVEIERNRAAVRISRADVHRIELSYGSGAERPIVTTVLGMAFLLAGLFAPVAFVRAILNHGIISSRSALLITFIFPGWWMLGLGLRRRWHLVVHTPRGSRKVLFDKRCASAEVEEFVAEAKQRFGYV